MTWLVRVLVFLVLFFAVRSLWFWFWRTGWKRLASWLLGSAGESTALPRERRGILKRDPVCGTHVDTSRAIREVTSAGEYYFCSEECRQQFLERQ